MSKKLVLFGEGEGDSEALPILAKRLLHEKNGWDALHLDKNMPFKVGEVSGLVYEAKNKNITYSKWTRLLRAALKRGNVGAILVVLDGDADVYPPKTAKAFCAGMAARDLAQVAATEVGAGKSFSLAIVFACQEFESWIIASVESLADMRLGNGRRAFKPGIVAPPPNIEQSPRGAKQWLGRNMEGGYNPVRDQAELTKLVDLDRVRKRQDTRSFRRLESAIDELIQAVRTGCNVCTPLQRN